MNYNSRDLQQNGRGSETLSSHFRPLPFVITLKYEYIHTSFPLLIMPLNMDQNLSKFDERFMAISETIFHLSFQ